MVSKKTIKRDVLLFLKENLQGNIDDPIIGSRKNGCKFVMTSYPERETQYPLITIKITNDERPRAGMQTKAQDVTLTIEIRVWARNQKEKDTLSDDVDTILTDIQFETNGSVDNDLHDFTILSGNELDEPGKGGIKSRIIGLDYKFYNLT